MPKIEMELSDLQDLLNKQKATTGEYMTRNLTIYSWFEQGRSSPIDKMKSELKDEAGKSPYPSDMNVLLKYLKP